MLERVERELPFSCEQIFDLAADVERYPEFVPLWISSRVLARGFNTVDVEQSVGFGPMRLSFVSQATLQRPTRIDVVAWGPPFRRYSMSMGFAVRAAAVCLVSIEADVVFESALLQHFDEATMPGFVAQVATAFAHRAAVLYGPPALGSSPRG